MPGKRSCGIICYQQPTQIPADSFIVELDPNGKLLLSSAFGGSQDDIANAIAVDSQGRIYVAGRTHSFDFPSGRYGCYGQLQGQSDAFLAVFEVGSYGDLVLDLSAYLGGAGDESAKGIALIPPPANSNVFADLVIAGWTNSFNFPVTQQAAQVAYQGGDSDGFVTRIQLSYLYGGPKGTSLLGITGIAPQIIYSTYLGGEGEEIVYGVSADATGVAHVTGYTRSRYFPTTFGCYQPNYGGGNSDAFLVKLYGNGSLQYSTYFGGSGDDYAMAVVGGPGQVYIVGYTDSYDLPVTADAYQQEEAGGWDIFAAIFADDGINLLSSTYFGLGNDEFAYRAVLDNQGNLVVAGSTNSTTNGTTKPLLLKFSIGLSHEL